MTVTRSKRTGGGARALLRPFVLALSLAALSCAPSTPRFDARRLTGELRAPFADWVAYWHAYDPAFALDSLRWTLADTVVVERVERITDSLRTVPRSRWWAWSPDRGRAVDPNVHREWDSDSKRFMYEPAAVSELLDFTTHTGTFLDSCGTDGRDDDACWLDRERFARIGWRDVDLGDSLFVPVVTVIDLARRTTATGTGRAARMTATP